jgi:hypothetical protein
MIPGGASAGFVIEQSTVLAAGQEGANDFRAWGVARRRPALQFERFVKMFERGDIMGRPHKACNFFERES